MRLQLPNVTMAQRDAMGYAARLSSLLGARVAVVDGWGLDLPNGTKGMYATASAIVDVLRRDYDATLNAWLLKASFSGVLSSDELRVVRESDLVINGEGL
jgi:hypothetical protein